MTTTTSMLAETITRTLQRTRGLADALLDGIEPHQFACFPEIGGTLIETNHPAFVYGHLSQYPVMLLDVMEIDAPEIAVPEGFEELFKNGAECVHDPDRTVYPSKDTITGYFNTAYDIGITRLAQLDDATLDTPFQGDEWYAEAMKTPGSLINFLLHDHYMFHLGQISAWRRCMGLGSAM